MRRIALIASLLSTLTVAAQTERPGPVAATPTLKLPAQVMAEPGKLFRISAETNCKRIRWKTTGIEQVPQDWLANPTKDIVGYAAPGTYRVECEGTLNDEWASASCLLIIGQQPPGPVPPAPPAPPGPASPLVQELQALYAADADAQKAAFKSKLVSLWSGVSGAALSDPELTTVGAVTSKMADCATKYPYMLVPADLNAIRLRLAKEITARVGPPATPLDDAKRKAASALFAEFVSALQLVK